MTFITVKLIYITWKVISFIPTFILSVIYHPIARKISWRRLPVVAKKLGLDHINSIYYSEFGKLSGTIQGHQVIVEPDENAKIIVHFKSTKLIQLWTKKDPQRPTEQMPGFKTADWKFNSIFKTRLAQINIAQKFIVSTNLIDHFVRFYCKRIWSLESIYISDQAIYCEFNYGHPFFPYIPSYSLENLISEIVSLTEHLDATL